MSLARLQIAAAVLVCMPIAVLANDQGGAPASASEAPRPSASATAPQPRSNSMAPTKAVERLREGTRLTDVPGTFTSMGVGGVSFAPDGGKDSYRLLQNLALERIGRALDDQRGPGKWIVSGVITEFRGANFLLVSKFQWQGGDAGPARP